ncbi:DUF3969 family protein [Psychrobacter lutiphocae]|uniref:DUF3969 family protein n=1 Tax=Psychrobacter lutiphocae TaxID=540500 RepID=UPI00036CEDD4|nr:DUF3969 family protein [Psychrobacter lutiphocae]
MTTESEKLNSGKLIFNIIAVGLIRLLMKNKIDFDQAHFLLFSPSALSRVEDNNTLDEFKMIIAKALELEDIRRLVGEEAYQNELKALEDELCEHLVYSDYEDMHKASRIITSLGIVENLEVKPKDNKVEVIAIDKPNTKSKN